MAGSRKAARVVLLFFYQQEAAKWIREQCALDYRTDPKIIAVVGLSGAGKSTVVTSLQDELHAHGHIVLDPAILEIISKGMNTEGYARDAHIYSERTKFSN